MLGNAPHRRLPPERTHAKLIAVFGYQEIQAGFGAFFYRGPPRSEATK